MHKGRKRTGRTRPEKFPAFTYERRNFLISFCLFMFLAMTIKYCRLFLFLFLNFLYSTHQYTNLYMRYLKHHTVKSRMLALSTLSVHVRCLFVFQKELLFKNIQEKKSNDIQLLSNYTSILEIKHDHGGENDAI